jgi:LysR family transcriptional regulator, transcriptional activator for bauABCD operon
MNLYCGRRNPLFANAPNGLTLEQVLAEEYAARGYVSNAQLPNFERKFLVGASSATFEGLANLVLSGRYTAYLPKHYAHHWENSDNIRPLLPSQIGYRSVYEMISRREAKLGKLLQMFIETPKLLHGPVEGSEFKVDTAL